MTTACSKKQSTVMSPIKIVFDPSFLYASELEVSDGNKPGLRIKVTRRNEDGSPETIHQRTVNISEEELQSIITGIKSFNLGYPGPQEGFGLDGISVYVISEKLEANDTIKFWSPRREGTDRVYYELIDPVFNLLRTHLRDDAEIMYVEQLEQYFEYGAPIKKIADGHYRIYGALSYFEHVTKAINSLIDEIPAGQPVLIDMSNFEGMGTIYYPHFKKLLAKNDRIKWIVNAQGREQLLEIGCPEANLEQTSKKGF